MKVCWYVAFCIALGITGGLLFESWAIFGFSVGLALLDLYGHHSFERALREGMDS